MNSHGTLLVSRLQQSDTGPQSDCIQCELVDGAGLSTDSGEADRREGSEFVTFLHFSVPASSFLFRFLWALQQSTPNALIEMRDDAHPKPVLINITPLGHRILSTTVIIITIIIILTIKTVLIRAKIIVGSN